MTRWYIGFLVAGVALYTVFVWFEIQTAIARGKALQAATTPFEQHPQDPNMHILVAGDSTAVGVGAQAREQSIAGRLGAQYPEADITNIGVSGLRLAGLQQKLAALADKKYDLVLLQIGANDITGGTSYENIKKELSEILQLADAMTAQIIVMTAGNVGLAPPFKWPVSWYISYRTKMVRSIFMNEVSKHTSASYVDLYKERAEEPFNKNIGLYYASDQFHPSGEGYGLWYQKLFLP